MSYYVEIEIHVYDQGQQTTGVGPFRSQAKAEDTAEGIEHSLRGVKAKAALDEMYGEDGYSVTVLALRLRKPSEAVAEITGTT